MTEPSRPIARQSHIGRVLLWMSGALACFCGMAMSIRGLAGTLNVFEMLSIRSGAGVVILLAIVAVRPQLRHYLVPRRMSLHLARNVMHFASQVAWAKSLLLLPLATVFAIEFTAPAWVTLFAVVFLGEKLTRSRLGSVLLGFVGVLIIMRPGVAAFQPAALLVLVAALGFAAVSVTTKKLTDTESTFSILFWMSLMQLPMNLAGSDLFFLTRLEQPHLLPAAGVAITGVAAHFCLTNAFRYGDALVVVPFDFLRIPFIAVIGWMMYGEPLDALVFVGAGVIVVGVIWNLRTEARQKPPPV